MTDEEPVFLAVLFLTASCTFLDEFSPLTAPTLAILNRLVEKWSGAEASSIYGQCGPDSANL